MRKKLHPMHNAFMTHRYGAKKRGVEFLLTFDEWLRIWEDSGHLSERGHSKGQYVMARFGDKGPYAVGNVKIATCEQNSSEKQQSNYQRTVVSQMFSGVPKSQEHRRKLSDANLGHQVSLETRQQISATLIGRKKSPETRLRMSLARRARENKRMGESHSNLGE